MIRRFLGLRSVSFQDVWGKGLDTFGKGTAAGERVTTESALQVTAVFGCVRILSDAISTLPADAYYRDNEARHPLAPQPEWLNHPSDEFGSIELRGQAMVSLLLEGNAYFATPRDSTGQVQSLIALDPTKVEPRRVKVDGSNRLLYFVDGKPFSSNDVLHVPGMMLPGSIKGMSPIAYCRETIGLALAAQRYGGSFFGNGAIPGALIETPGQVTEIGAKQLKRAWNDIHRGASNANQVAVLTEGAKFTRVSLPPNEAQFLETRAFQVPDIARIYGVPPHLLADASNSTSWGSGLAEQNVAFAQYSVRPWTERLEAGFTRLLLSEGSDPRAFIKLNLESLQRGAFKDQMESLAIGLSNGIYNLDEVRALLDHTPLPFERGQGHMTPVSLKPLSGKETDPAVINAVGVLIRAGFDPESTLAALGLPPITHSGLLPVTLQSEKTVDAEAVVAVKAANAEPKS